MRQLNEFYRDWIASRPVEPVVLKEPIPLEELHTPALVIDLDAFEANLDRMQSHLSRPLPRQHNIKSTGLHRDCQCCDSGFLLRPQRQDISAVGCTVGAPRRFEQWVFFQLCSRRSSYVH